MTRPITPNPGIHQATGRTARGGAILTPQQIEAWAVQVPLAMTKHLLTAIFNALEAEIPPALRGPIQNAENALEEVSTAVESALTAIPGGNLTGALNTALTVSGTQIGAIETDISALATAISGVGSTFENILIDLSSVLSPALAFIGHVLQSLGAFISGLPWGLGATVGAELQSWGATLASDASSLDGDYASWGAQISATLTSMNTSLTDGLTDAASGMATQAGDVEAATEHLAIIGNGAEQQVSVDFSTFSDGSLPVEFTEFFGVGAHPAISAGELVFTDHDNAAYDAASFLTDYQQVSGSWSSATTADLWARLSISAETYIRAVYVSGVWQLVAFVNNSPVWQLNLADTFTAAAEYTLTCGDPTTLNPHYFQILKNGVPLVITASASGPYSSQVGQDHLADTSNLSSTGGGFRTAGCGGADASMSSFAFQDTIQSSPSVLVPTSESTSSTTYTDLPTVSDEVAVNIGPKGIADVKISAQTVSASTHAALMSFTVSQDGTTVIDADDDHAIGGYNSSGTWGGGSFLLTTADGLIPGKLALFKCKYKSTAGTATFTNRRVGVVAL